MMIHQLIIGLALLCAGFGAGFLAGRKSLAEPAPVQANAPVRIQWSRPQPLGASDKPMIDPPQGSSTIGVPLDGLQPSDVLDTFDQARGTDRKHEATDLMAPAGTPVRAVVDGKIEKLFLSNQGGNTVYLIDEAEKHVYYYAHLSSYHGDLQEGDKVKRGDILAYVGATGNASPDAPHLHFAIFELGPEKQWWKGTPINPYPLLLEAVQSMNRNGPRSSR